MPKSPAPLLQGTLDPQRPPAPPLARGCSITAAGRKQLAEQREGWSRFSDALQAILETT